LKTYLRLATLAAVALTMLGCDVIEKHQLFSSRQTTETIAAAKQGDVDAQLALGFMYDHGKGVSENDAEAVKWYRKAADQGLAMAQLNLAIMYYNGYGVSENKAEAVKWYRKAADQGKVGAQYSLGVMYSNGDGVPENDAEAVKWYRRAAGQGDVDAQSILAFMYVTGEGIPKSPIDAYVWWSMAKTQGDAEAAGNLDLLKSQLTRKNIYLAQALATTCYESDYKDCDWYVEQTTPNSTTNQPS